MLLTPAAVYGQQDGPTPAEECRFITNKDLADAKAPSFRRYPVAKERPGPIAKLDLNGNPIARTYRTVLRLEMTKGANFAGHYRVAVWGCGISCAMFAVVNLKTGMVITPKEFGFVSGTELATDDDFIPRGKADSGFFRHRKDSALLVVLGAPDEDESRAGAYYFLLREERLNLVHSTRVDKDCANLKP
jgi:hypothetical protein